MFSTDHKAVGVAYALTALLFLALAFGLVLLMRWQLAYPGEPIPGAGRLFGPDHPTMAGGVMQPNFYNQLGAMHGTLMVFLAVVPLAVAAFGTYLVPLMIGAANMAFPRLSRIGFWCYVAGGFVILSSFFTELGPANSGWTSYPPLSVIELAGQTYWLAGMALVYLSNLLLSINLIVTVVQLRAPGMHFMRLPFFVWSQLVAAVLLLLAFPPLAAAAVLQIMDRVSGSSFFLPSGLVVSGRELEVSGGGSALLWQHLFWFLAHPEVYVLILPAFGIVAEIIANNSRKPLWGYKGMVMAAKFMGLMSMLVWAHHMYLTGMGTAMNAFFQATTLIISIPSIILATSLVVSLWGGSIRFTVPMLFALAFLPMFAMGGFTGIPLALSATNIVLHDTYYVIGHFHYVVAPGTLFALFAGIYYWFPRVTGRRMNDLLGRIHFWPTLFFMNMVFLPMMVQGLGAVSRRLYDGGMTYAHGQDVFFLNKAATHSAFALAIVQLPFVINFVYSLFWGKKAAENPWDATTMEWAGENELELRAHRGPYDYSAPGQPSDFTPQWRAETS
ncbi:MAG: cytochrome-c oxidase [Candidatus Hydrogenedentota bacterium]